MLCHFTIDVENWWHILDTPATPPLSAWAGLESRLEIGLDRLLQLLDRHQIQATMFWLGWTAEHHPEWVRRCAAAGHEIACQGYAHTLLRQLTPADFSADVERAKKILEDISGQPVYGYRAPGFSLVPETAWAFEVLCRLGFRYDSSVFPANHGHGGWPAADARPYPVQTAAGSLTEIPITTVPLAGRQVCLFGGGYLRLAPLWLIRLALRRLPANQALVLYIHPRELDPEHPRLPLSPRRRFKSYVGLRTIPRKLDWFCRHGDFRLVHSLAAATGQESENGESR